MLFKKKKTSKLCLMHIRYPAILGTAAGFTGIAIHRITPAYCGATEIISSGSIRTTHGTNVRTTEIRPANILLDVRAANIRPRGNAITRWWSNVGTGWWANIRTNRWT